MTVLLKKSFNLCIKGSDEDSRTKKFQLSSENIDRDGDIIRQNGFDWSDYKKNPMVLFNHNKSIPIGSGVDWEMIDGVWQAGIRFASKGVSEKADEIYRLIEDEIIRTVSIGFIPIDAGWVKIDERDVFEYRKIKMLEISVLALPSNADAALASKSFKEKMPKKENINFIKLNESEKRFIELEEI